MQGLLDLFQSGAVGGIVGGVFGWLGRKEDNSHAQEMLSLKIKQLKELSVLKVGELDAEAHKESQKSLSAFGDAIKSAFRPVITTLLMVETMRIRHALNELMGGIEALPMADVVELYSRTTHDIVALTAMSIAWWFGARVSYSRK